MTSKLLFTVAVVALGTGAAFSQTQTGQQQQPTAGAAQQPVTQAEAPVREQVAAGECAARMQEVSGGEFFAGETAAYRQHLGVLSDLRDSAMQLQAEGLDEACLQVVDAMETAIAGFQGDAQTGGAMGGLATRGDVTREQLEQRLVAVDASEMPINTARLEGTDLYSMDGEDIGNVEGFLMAQGKPTHMIVSHGGFWDIGDNDVAIPLDIVRWDPEWQTFFAPLTDEQLDEAPDYDESAWDGATNDQYYQAFRG
jgi:hypothetical protein